VLYYLASQEALYFMELVTTYSARVFSTCVRRLTVVTKCVYVSSLKQQGLLTKHNEERIHIPIHTGLKDAHRNVILITFGLM
jgi:hypothetical protein